jgi:N-acetylmuramoyl-L-alanine amidase
MGGYYTVVQGDHLSKIAKDNGFPDYHIIWDHPNNAELKDKRKNPNVLYPGDQVFVPDKEEKQESGSTEKRHTFQVKKEPLKLRLVLEDYLENPIANAPYALLVEGEVTQKNTDGKGHIEQDIPLDAHEAVLVIRGDETPFQDVAFPVRIGDLDPVEEVSGQLARLDNLGYFPGDGTDQDAFRSAVEEFQCDHGLSVDGKCGPITQAKLKKVHGC